MTDADILAEHDLPDPDTLGVDDDFSRYLVDTLPQHLKTRALRRLWRVNPVLANLDGLLDYGEDYTDAATVVENLKTSYEVGRGMAAHVEALAEAAKEPSPDDQPEPKPQAPEAASAADAAKEQAPEGVSDAAAPTPTQTEQPQPAPPKPEDDLDMVAARPRRLRITFDTDAQEPA